MQAKAYLDHLLEQGKVIRLAHIDGERHVSRGHAIILNQKLQIAIMLEDCGRPSTSGIRAGDIVEYLSLPDAESLIHGSPARIE